MTKINEPTLFLLKKLWIFSKGNRNMLILYSIFFIFSNLINLIEPLILATVINEIQNNWLTSNNFNYLSLIIFSWIWISLIFWLFHWTARIIEKKNAFLVRYNYQTFLLNKVLKFDLSWHNDKQSWNTIDKVNKASDTLFKFSAATFRIYNIIIKIIWTTIILSFFNIYLSIWVLLLVFIILYIIFLFDKKLVTQYKEINLIQNNISAKIYDVLSNITSVMILNIKKLVLKDISDKILSQKDIYNKNVVLTEQKWFVWDVLFQFILVLPIFFYLWLNVDNKNPIEIWTITALYMYLSKLMWVFFWFSDLYWTLIKQKTDIENAKEIEFCNQENIKKENKIREFKKLKINDLYFNYDNKAWLKNINFEVNSWEKIAIIWHSGSWKTTFLKIIHWLYSAKNVNIFIDNKKIEKSIEEINLSTILVPQEPELFSHSIRENITFWLEYENEKVLEFIKLACFEKKLEKLPKWLESKINEKWVNLSGWEKQRLTLARALLFAQNKNLILLDESTSSVDSKNEERIYKNIFSFFKKKTIIASIHKLNILKYFDRIVIFDNWEILDNGTFKELLDRSAYFKDMWENFIKNEK